MGIIRVIKQAIHEAKKKKARELTPPQYMIFDVGDFADIPPERWDAFLEDFEQFVKTAREWKGKSPFSGGFIVNGFTWTDDGKHVGTVYVRGKC